MPDIAPSAVVPATPAPDLQPPAVAPVPASVPQSPPPSQEKLSKRLHDLLTAPTGDPTEPKKPEAKKPELDATPAADAPKQAEDKPIRVKKAATVKETPPPVPSRRDLVPTPVAPAQAAAPARSQAEDDASLEKELVEEERALLDDARAAEKHLGEKYKGHAAKTTAFLRENIKKSDALDKGDIDETEYNEWYSANAPRISALDARQLERARVKEDVKREFEPQLEAERHARWSESETPKVKSKANGTFNKLIASSIPDDFAKAISEKTKGINPATHRDDFMRAVNEVEKDYVLEKEITENIVSAATNDLEELDRLSTVNPSTGRALTALAADAQIFDGQKWVPNPNATTPEGKQHARVLTMIRDFCNNFKATGGADLKKDGKWFVTREEWADMTPAQRSPFWTFSNDDIAARAGGHVKAAVQATVQQQRKMLEERYGFSRRAAVAAVPAQPVAPQPASGAPPAPRPSPPPSAGSGGMPSLAQSLASKLTSVPTQS